MLRQPPHSPPFPYTTLFRSHYGSFVAVDDISLDIPQGVLYGCLGPNGAGKTTTLRMIAGILRPTNGRVLLGGDDVHARSEEHTSELQSHHDLVCRLLLEKKK